jgi:CubicO group peptidase (beta-lactamase class C family)
MRKYLLLVLLLAGSGCTPASVEPYASLEAFTAHLDERLPRLMDRYDVPGATLALVQRGEVAWTGAYGYADRAQRRPMTVDAVFRAESISKPVTAWGVMRLVEQGRIDLDAPVERYLGDVEFPETAYDERAVTVRRLLSNSAGLPLGPIGSGAEYPPESDMPSLRDYLSEEARLVQEPGAEFAYSNVGYNALELLIEEVTGRDFAAYMADEVLQPLGMRRSRFGWTEGLRDAMPMGYELDSTPVPPYVYPVNASGGLLAPVEDIARFVGAETTGSFIKSPPDTKGRVVLQPESIRQLHRPQVEIGGLFGFVADAYGLGHFLETLPDGRHAVWHGGQGHGWMTHFHAVPESSDGIVILTNSERSWPLMAQVLRDWARWSELGSVKFAIITFATTALWILTGLIALAALGQAYRLAHGWRSGRRKWAPLARAARLRRSLQALGAIGVIALLAWSLAQPYLFVTSVFPNAASWAGITLFLGATVMGLSALLPCAAP